MYFIYFQRRGKLQGKQIIEDKMPPAALRLNTTPPFPNSVMPLPDTSIHQAESCLRTPRQIILQRHPSYLKRRNK